MRMSEGSDWIEVWLDMVGQISLFFNRASLFSTHVIRVICLDSFFCKCHWIAEDIDTLLYSIKVHIEAAKLARNYCKEFLNLINWKWGMDAEEYIWSRGLIKQTLKLITKRPNVLNLKTGLFLVNIQAVKQIMEGKTFYLHRLFLTLQDW